MTLVGNSHLISGTAEDVPLVLALLEQQGIETISNPDIYTRTYTSFGIDEARELRERASSRAFGSVPASPLLRQSSEGQARLRGAQRVFIIATPSMTNEAQNALLKTLEEPPGDALFFFIVASPESLLATLRSRTQMLSLGSMGSGGVIDVRVFLGSSPAIRLNMLKPLFGKDEDEPGRSGKRDMTGVLTFLSSLERILAKGSDRDRVTAGAEAVYRARKYISDKGSLLKPLLEQVALLVPVIKAV